MLQRLARLARIGHSNEAGSALVAVIGVMVVGMILTALIATTLVNSFGTTTGTRAGVQSHAAADAGIVAARTALFTPASCAAQPVPGVYTSSVEPKFTVKVEYNTATGWQAGCPPLTATRLRLVSVGAAKATGVAGVSSGDQSKVETIFQYLTPGPPPTGVGMFLFGGGEFEANANFDISEAGATGLITKNGNLVCSNNNTIFNASILINGNLDFGSSNKCTVTGDAWVSGDAKLGSKGTIGGNLTAASVTASNVDTQVGGDYSSTGTPPDSPDWVNVTYQPTDWKDQDGHLFEVRTPSDCKLPNGNLGGTMLGQPVIINLLSCPNGAEVPGQTPTITLTSDVVIFANAFKWPSTNKITFKSSSAAAYRLWLITPDNGPVDDNKPTCNNPANSYYDSSKPKQDTFSTKNNITITTPIKAMAYTPCAFDGKNGFTWNGQIYAGEMSYAKNNPTFTFEPVGIAGVDLTTGDEDLPDITKPQPGAVISMRDVNSVPAILPGGFGLLIGSFLNVVDLSGAAETLDRVAAERLPDLRAQIRSWDNIPVLSWLCCAGSARTALRRFRCRYPMVEFGTGLFFAAVAGLVLGLDKLDQRDGVSRVVLD